MENEQDFIRKAKDIELNRDDSLERRVYRLESTVIELARVDGEMMDRLKNAHHRIDETNTEMKEFKEEMRNAIEGLDKKIENIGTNLANRDKRDKVFKRALLGIGILALASFCGLFIKNTETASIVAQIASKLAVGVIV